MNAYALLNCCQGDQGMRKLKTITLQKDKYFHSFLTLFPVAQIFVCFNIFPALPGQISSEKRFPENVQDSMRLKGD